MLLKDSGEVIVFLSFIWGMGFLLVKVYVREFWVGR